MAKLYSRINWQNAPSTATPRNATNLNKMDKGIDDIDTKLSETNDNLAAIASAVTSAVTAVPTGAGTSIVSLSLAPGTYIIFGGASFSANATGLRRLYFDVAGTWCGTMQAPATSGLMPLSISYAIKLSATTTVSLCALQDSGASLNINSGAEIKAVRLK